MPLPFVGKIKIDPNNDVMQFSKLVDMIGPEKMGFDTKQEIQKFIPGSLNVSSGLKKLQLNEYLNKFID